MVIDMPASYPNSVKPWTDKQDNIDDAFAGDTNGAYHEIIAVETELMQVGYKRSVRAATTQNGALATAFANGQTIDGVVLATGDRILIKDQTNGAENGIYAVNASGAPTRAIDANTDALMVTGLMAYVREGTVNAKGTWKLTTTGAITLGTTPLAFENEVAAHKADKTHLGNNPIAKVKHSINQTIANNAETVLSFDTEVMDNDTIYDSGVPTRLTCKTAGKYLLLSQVAFDANITGDRVVIIMVNDGTLKKVCQVRQVATNAGGSNMLAFAFVDLQPGNFAYVIVLQSSGNSLNVLSTPDYTPIFEMVKVG
jgi:hypothetical protein